MKGMKGKLLKKLKSIKPIGYLKQDRILQLSVVDGFIETLPRNPSLKDQNLFICKEPEPEKVKEGSDINQGPDIIDVEELMRDLEEQEEEMELDDNNINDKENIRPAAEVQDPIGVKDNRENFTKRESSSFSHQTPLSEIDISSFRRPDLNSGSLFDPKLLAAFEQAVKEHIRMTEAERQARIERENLERQKQEAEKQASIEQENLGKSREARIEDENLEEEDKEEPPSKTRRIEADYNPLLSFEERCPPGGCDSVILYSTTLRGIRKTFEDCSSVRFLLESFRVVFFERDVSMHMEYKEELWRVLNGKAMPPKLFIKGRYIGGAEDVLGLHEQGKLRVLFEGIPIDRSIGPCETCAGVRFVLCFNCSGSHKIISNDGLLSKCQICNENGLIICPLCC